MRRLTVALALGLAVVSGASGWARDHALPLFKDDLGPSSLRQALRRSLDFFDRVPADSPVGEQPRLLTARMIRESLLAFMEHLHLLDRPRLLREKLEQQFELYEPMAGDKRADVLFTGYYQPRIEASLSESGDYRFPIYRRPADLVEMESDKPREKVVGRLEGAHLVPYWSRHEIDIQGKLRGRGYEIAWVKDPVELFFLHIQGSGILKLDDGRMLQINYEASNGRPYRSIGRMLIDNGRVAERDLSMQRLRLYLAEHPEERDQVLAHNESYIFFRVVPDGPLGSLGVRLTPGRSIATDPRFFPRGAVAFIATRKPVLNGQGNFIGWQAFSRFVFNQDRGSGIRGPGRVDLYFGTGDSAGLAAGAMNSRGRVYFLLKKTHVP